MRENRVKKVMGQGQLAIGGYVSLADPQVVEIIGLAGFDAAFIDMEHTGFDLALVGEMIRAADLVGATSIVRVPDNDATANGGAHGRHRQRWHSARAKVGHGCRRRQRHEKHRAHRDR